MTTKTKTTDLKAAPPYPLQGIIDFCAEPANRGAKKRIREIVQKATNKKLDHRCVSMWLHKDAEKRIVPVWGTGNILLAAGEKVMEQMRREQKKGRK